MRNLFLILAISVCLIPVSFAQGQKVLIKSFVAETNHVVIDMHGQVQVNEWDEDFIKVTSLVEINNFSEEVLMRLIMVKRYAIVSETIGDIMKIKIPNLAKEVSIKGEMLDEVVRYDIFVPRGIKVDVAGVLTSIYQ